MVQLKTLEAQFQTTQVKEVLSPCRWRTKWSSLWGCSTTRLHRRPLSMPAQSRVFQEVSSKKASEGNRIGYWWRFGPFIYPADPPSVKAWGMNPLIHTLPRLQGFFLLLLELERSSDPFGIAIEMFYGPVGWVLRLQTAWSMQVSCLPGLHRETLQKKKKRKKRKRKKGGKNKEERKEEMRQTRWLREVLQIVFWPLTSTFFL